jgi:cytochrome c oxidase subunit 3
MSHAADASGHEEHIHLPEPSLWPFAVAISAGLIPTGVLFTVNQQVFGPAVLGAGLLLTIFCGLGWCTSVIREKHTIDQAWGNQTLSLAWKLFLLSEAAIFGAFFGHYFYMLYHIKPGQVWPPEGTPDIHLIIPAAGTIILMLSSVTCEFAHKALLVSNRSLCKTWMVITLVLGLIFLILQGYEWGVLGGMGFNLSTNIVGTLFYLITGFHGFHVVTGMMFLFLVYVRIEVGSFDRKRHFSMNAASWYWHFVDVIWLLVFLTLYLGIQKH